MVIVMKTMMMMLIKMMKIMVVQGQEWGSEKERQHITITLSYYF